MLGLRLAAVLIGPLMLVPALPALAAAAPVTVDLRIEGRSSTLYEGAVSTDIRTIDAGDGTGSHTCDGTNFGANPSPGTTRGAAFVAAAAGLGSAPGFSFAGSWSAAFEDVSFSSVAGEDVSFDATTNSFLGEFKNGVGSFVGSCQDIVATGDQILYAYAPFGSPVLKLSGPERVRPGDVATLKVTNAETATPVAGAAVGGETTGADGTAQVRIAARGPAAFKATKQDAIRSNRAVVCATDGADGACGTSVPGSPASSTPIALCATNGRDGRCGTRDASAPGITIRGIAEGRRFARGKGPRRIQAVVDADPSGLLQVKLRLTRTDRGHCTYFSGKSERFRPTRGGRCAAAAGYWFAVGDKAQVDYLLPSALPRGRYVLDLNVIDRAYNRDDRRRRGVNRIVFHVS